MSGTLPTRLWAWTRSRFNAPPIDPYKPRQASDGSFYIDFAAICEHELRKLRGE